MHLLRILFLCLAVTMSPTLAHAQDDAAIIAGEAHDAVADEGIHAVASHADVSAADHGEEGGSAMPQLDPTYYASQLFWLFLSGITLYVLMARVALPRVSAMIDARDERVRDDLQQAYRLKHKAEDLKIDYTRALRDADERAASAIDRAIRDMKDRQSVALGEGADRIRVQIADTEVSLRAKADAVKSELSAISAELSKALVSKVRA